MKLTLKQGNPESIIFKISNETRFALLTKDNVEVNSPVSCRTFLAEIVWSWLGKGNCPRTDYKKEELDKDFCKMSVKFKTGNYFKNFMDNKHLLKELEESIGLTPTEIHVIKDKKDTIIVIGDKRWQKVWAITLYSFLIKYFAFENGVVEYPEHEYYNKYANNKEKLLRAVFMDEQEEYCTCSIDVHCDGFISMCCGYSINSFLIGTDKKIKNGFAT